MRLSDIEINGGLLPVLDNGGYIVTANKIWSENTGRSTINGDLTGDIIAIKITLDLKWTALKDDELQQLIDCFSNLNYSFFNVTYCYNGAERTGSFYASDLTYTLSECINGTPIYTDISVSLIER